MASRSRAGLLAGLALALLLLAPLLGPGVVLVRDMAWVPRAALGERALGLTGVPRAVPSDLLVALGSRVVPGGWLQDLVLVGLVVGGAWGAARLAPTGVAGGLAAATAYGWSPYLHERLLLGQWALLLGWAALPWAVGAALAWRRGGSWVPVVLALSVAACGGASSLLLVGLAVVLCGRPLPALGAVVVLSLPWAVPALLADSRPGDPAGVAAFASSGDGPLGVVGALLTGGGAWAAEVAPPGRAAGTVVALAVLLVAATGLPAVRHALGDRLLVAGAVGLVLSLLGVLPGTSALLRSAVVHVPASGLLRDGQKWLAPFVLLVAVALACATDRLVAAAQTPAAARVLAVALVAAPLAALPGAAWGEGGRLSSARFPADWDRVLEQAHGQVAVLPWTAYRRFPWSGGEPVLDPAGKLLAEPLVSDDLPLTRGRVRGEDPAAEVVGRAVAAGGPLLPALREVGAAQVLVERTTAGFDETATAAQVAGLELVVETTELALYAVPGGGRSPQALPAWQVVPGDAAALALVGVAGVLAVRRRRGPSTDRQPSPTT